MADSIPLVLITGQVARPFIGTDAFQEAPVYNIMSACAKHVFLVSDETKLEATMRTAFEIARSGRPGPVVVDVPKDVQNHIGPFAGRGSLELKGYDSRVRQVQEARLSAKDIEDFFRMLSRSHRPLIYAGGGVISGNAAAELRAFADAFGIPVVTTLMGIGSVDTTKELSLHMLGMHGTAYANYAVEDCDFLMAVGARFDDRVAGKVSEFAKKAKIAHIDIDAAEISKIRRADWYHVGEAKTALSDLMAAGAEFKHDFSRWTKHVAKLKKEHPLAYDENAPLIQPPEVLRALNEITRGDAIICTGVGQHQMWAAQYFDFHQPRSFITSGSMGTMGFGLPASIGAKIGRPDKIVVDIDGDGSLRMNIGELETAATYHVPVKILLLNNRGDGMVLQWQRLYFGRRFSGTDKTLRTKDFQKIAQADGFTFTRQVRERAELKKALNDFIECPEPAFLEVMTDQNADVYPMVGPGQGYEDMITGPHIAAREQSPHEREEHADLF
jgi:acetolactate synthase-1/2/3 large subunit